jgi:hypothetical protein
MRPAHVLEQREAFLLVFHQRVALPYRAGDAFLGRVGVVERARGGPLTARPRCSAATCPFELARHLRTDLLLILLVAGLHPLPTSPSVIWSEFSPSTSMLSNAAGRGRRRSRLALQGRPTSSRRRSRPCRL